jgi:hypothetical protein
MAKVVTISALDLECVVRDASLPAHADKRYPSAVFGVLNIIGNASNCGLTASQLISGASSIILYGYGIASGSVFASQNSKDRVWSGPG